MHPVGVTLRLLACAALLLAGCFDVHGRRSDAGSEDAGAPVRCGAEGRGCDDGDPCTVGDVCREGLCVGSVMRCELGDACRADGVCVDGACVNAPLEGACDDADPCTAGDTCVAGACRGEPIVCDSPAAPVCLGADAIREQLLPGACVAGACRYPEVERECPDGCASDACVCVPTPWSSETVDENGDVGRTNAIAIDAAGVPHLAYYLAPLPANLRHATRASDGSWQVEDVDTVGDVGSSPEIAIDEEGLVHIVHDDLTNLSLRYARQRRGGGWDLEEVEAGGTFWGGSLVVRAGVVHVAYTTETARFDTHLRYAERAPDGTWSHTTIATGEAVGVFASLAVDALGGVHVVHLDGSRQALEHAHRAPGASEFQTSTIDDVGIGGGNAIAADRTGGLHVAYFRETSDQLMHGFRDREGRWTTEPVPGAEHARWNVSLAVDPEDGVHVLFDSDMPELFHAHRAEGGAWSVTQVASTGFALSYLGGAALTLDALGDVHVSHYDERDRALRYATRRACP